MIAWLKCKFAGHLRGKLDKALTTQTEKVFRCPRCRSTWTRKVSNGPKADH